MKNLKEKQFLVNMALSLGQTPDPALVKELEEHKKIMDTVTPMGEEFGSLMAQLKQLKDEVDTIKTTVEIKQQYFPEAPKEFPKPPTLDELMASLPVEEVVETVIEKPTAEVVTSEVEEPNPLIKLASEHITKESKIEEGSYQQPDTPLVKSLDDIRKKIKFLEGWISKISMAGPGGGEVNLLKLDDVDTSAIGDGKVLAYSAANAKIEFRTSAGGTGAVDSVNGLTGTVVLSSANISEDTNFYFTNARVYSAVTGNLALKSNVVDLTTANVSELTNLYYTNARVYSNVVSLGYITSSALSGYATNSQLESYATTSYVGNALADLVASAPASLDTLNELAAALGNDNNFSTTVLTYIGTKRQAISVVGAGSYDNTTGIITIISSSSYSDANTYSNVTLLGYITSSALSGYATNSQLSLYATNTNVNLKANIVDLTTANVIELNSLYFTDARARQAISTSGCTLSYSNTTGIISFSQGNTDTVNEGSTNLYFTNARSRAAISVGSGGSYDNSTGIITITGGFVASSVTVFPGHSGNEDYGDLTTTTVDAFGVATGTAYDCMEPVGSLVSEDLVVL